MDVYLINPNNYKLILAAYNALVTSICQQIST